MTSLEHRLKEQAEEVSAKFSYSSELPPRVRRKTRAAERHAKTRWAATVPAIVLVTALVVAAALMFVRTRPAQIAATSAPVSGMFHVSISDGCPATITQSSDVSNSGSGLDRHVVPATPTAALICRYTPIYGSTRPEVKHGVLYGHLVLNATESRKLAGTLNAARQPAQSQPVMCPSDDVRNDLVVFAANGRSDIDVLAHDSGCPSVTNGARKISALVGTALIPFIRAVNLYVHQES